MNITIVSAVHGRRELWGIFSAGLTSLTQKLERLGFEYNVCIACSTEQEADYFFAKGYTVLITGNDFLGKKWNDAIEWAWMQSADYVLMIGSDDLISPKLLDIYYPYIKDKVPFFGIEQMYFLDLKREVLKEFKGWTRGKRMTIGCGRMIHKSVLKKVHGRPAKDKIKRGLDTSILVNLRKHGYDDEIVEVDGYWAIDIKTKNNLNKYESISGVEYTPDFKKLNLIFNTTIK